MAGEEGATQELEHEEEILQEDGAATGDDEQSESEDRGDFLPDDTDDAGEMDEPEPQPVDQVDGDQDTGGVMIPKGRVDEIISERNFLREQLARATGGQKEEDPGDQQAEEPPAFDFAAKRREQMQAWDDGDDELYDNLETEIAQATDQMITDKATQIAGDTIAGREAEVSQARALGTQDTILEDHPELKEDGNEYYAFLGHRNKFLKDGKSMDQALKLAETAVFGKGETGAKPQPGQKRTQREILAASRNAQAANQQPPNLEKGTGQRDTGGAVKVKDMSDEEFDKIPAAEVKRLRGD